MANIRNFGIITAFGGGRHPELSAKSDSNGSEAGPEPTCGMLSRQVRKEMFCGQGLRVSFICNTFAANYQPDNYVE